VELFRLGNVVLVRGRLEGSRNMYCDGCGRQVDSGVRYCSGCGKQLMTGPATSNVPTAAARAVGDGRVRRNINTVAGLWLANGILRLMGVAWWMIFRRLIFDGGWPFVNWEPGFRSLIWGGMFSTGIFLAFFGVIHLLLAWGLYERQPWARMLGIVVGYLALIRIPFGTALGIYTLWVLAPEGSGQEYEEMVGVPGRVSVAR
jgi:hypothetical protein